MRADRASGTGQRVHSSPGRGRWQSTKHMLFRETEYVRRLGRKCAVQTGVHPLEAYDLHLAGLPVRQSPTQQETYMFPASQAKSRSRTGQRLETVGHEYACLIQSQTCICPYFRMKEKGVPMKPGKKNSFRSSLAITTFTLTSLPS